MDRDEGAGAAELLPAEARAFAPAKAATGLPWIQVAPGAPYFMTDDGEPWTPIGQNDAISWVELNGLFRRRDLPGVERHLDWLSAHGVTCLRLMLEYMQIKHRWIERPAGRFPPSMVQLWDDLFALCEKRGLRLLITPFDTFWTWLRWQHHPYNVTNGGPLTSPSRILLCPETRELIKGRLTFAVERWGGSGALFAWDLWNEIHPAQSEECCSTWGEFIADLSEHVRRLETHLYGRTHPQTVSLFGPELWWRPELPLAEPIFRHPDLDFATIHIYRECVIDDPVDTVAAGLAMGAVTRMALSEIRDARPFLDTEHGPIHSYKDRRKVLPEPFDDEYFRHMQWAHLASGAAGGGMRWPNRRPHTLTAGMRRAQEALSRFLPLVDWLSFRRVNLNEEVRFSSPAVKGCACGDGRQAVAWLVREDTIGADGLLRRDAPPVATRLSVPGLAPGSYRITAFDTLGGTVAGTAVGQADGEGLSFDVPPFVADLALAIRRS